MSKRQEWAEPTHIAAADVRESHVGIEDIPDAVLVAEVESGRIVDANSAAGELFHCHPKDLIGRHQSGLHPAEDTDAYVAAFERSIEEGRVNRLQGGEPLFVETDEGVKKPVEINVRELDSDTGDFVLGVFREATDQLARESKLEETTTRLETLLDALPLPVAVLDIDGTVDRWNRAATETFGYAREAVIDEPYPLFTDEGEFETLAEQILDGGILDGYETTHRARDGSRIRVKLYARPLYKEGSPTGIIGAAVDISDQTRHLQQLDVLYRVMRHNLRNELTIIQGWVDEIGPQSGVEDQSKRDGARERITDATQRLINLSDQANQIQSQLESSSTRQAGVPVQRLVTGIDDLLPTVSSGADTDSTAGITVPEPAEAAVSDLARCVSDAVGRTPIEVRLERKARFVVLELAGDTQLLTDEGQRLITHGYETNLEHGSDLRIAQIYFAIQSLGGEILISEGDRPQTIRIELPRLDIDAPLAAD